MRIEKRDIYVSDDNLQISLDKEIIIIYELEKKRFTLFTEYLNKNLTIDNKPAFVDFISRPDVLSDLVNIFNATIYNEPVGDKK